MVEKYSEVVPMKEMKKRLKKMQKEGQTKLNVEMSTVCLKTCMQEVAPMIQYVLFNTPESKNYLTFSFINDKDENYNFEVCFHKHGKRWPGDPLLLMADHAFEDVVATSRKLRQAQREYMLARGNPDADVYGKAVAEAAELLDIALARVPETPEAKRG